jgi:hypothetical protein
MLGFTMAQTDADFSCVAFSMIKLMSVVAKKHGECPLDISPGTPEKGCNLQMK